MILPRQLLPAQMNMIDWRNCMKNMNLPNKLTMLRVILIPFFVVCELIPYSWGKWAALVIFVAASITDKLDGTIARKYNLITNFGNSWIHSQTSC